MFDSRHCWRTDQLFWSFTPPLLGTSSRAYTSFTLPPLLIYFVHLILMKFCTKYFQNVANSSSRRVPIAYPLNDICHPCCPRTNRRICDILKVLCTEFHEN